MSKFCGKCGARLDEETGLCPNCDADSFTKINEQIDAAENEPIIESESFEDAPYVPATDETEENPAPRKKHRGRKIVIAAAVLVVLVATAAIFLLRLGLSGGFLGGSSGSLLGDNQIAVNFDCNAPDSETDYEPEAQIINKGETASCPPFPVRDGYKFNGWYEDIDCTMKYDFGIEVTENTTLYAKWIDADSEEAKITDEEINIFFDVVDEIMAISDERSDENGFINAEEDRKKVLYEIEKYLESLRENQIITFYDNNGCSVYVEFSSGIPYSFQPKEEGQLSSGSDISIVAIDAAVLNDTKNYVEPLQIYDVDPEASAADFQPVSSMIANMIYEELNTSMSMQIEEFKNQIATYNNLKTGMLNDISILLWSGHGSYSEKNGSALYTGDVFTTKDELKDFMNSAEPGTYVINNKGDSVGITGLFVDKYISLDHAFVYLSACHSGQDFWNENGLTAAFMRKGGDAIIHNLGKEGIYAWYSDEIMMNTLRYMTGCGYVIDNNQWKPEQDNTIYSASMALALSKTYMKRRLSDHFEIDTNQSFLYYDFTNNTGSNGVVYSPDSGDFKFNNDASFVHYSDSYPILASGSDYDYTICGVIEGVLTSSDESVVVSDVTLKLVALDEPHSTINVQPYWPDRSGLSMTSDAGAYQAFSRNENGFGPNAFYFNGLPGGDYELDFYYEGKLIKRITTIDVDGHHYIDIGTVDLSNCYRLTFDIVDQNGSELTDAHIELDDGNNTYVAFLDYDANEWVTKAEVPKGTYQLKISAAGYETIEATITIKKDADLEYEMVCCGKLAGTVFDKETNQPLSGALIQCYYDDGVEDYYEATTDKHGSYSIEHMRAGSYTVICAKDDYITNEGKLDVLSEQGMATGCDVYLQPNKRAIALVLDVSGSMGGTPLTETKSAAIRFVNQVTQEGASVCVITYSDSASMVANFSTDRYYLADAINSIRADGRTNVEAGLYRAQSALQGNGAKKQMIVLMGDGLPNEGYEGSALINYADNIKKSGIYIYTMGFFSDLDSSQRASAQSLMESLASSGYHYEVDDSYALVYFFSDIAGQINGQRYVYIRIACPVDVTVSYDGETLCSKGTRENTRTDFGVLTYETDENEVYGSSDNRVKVLRLKEGVPYELTIEGNGSGTMNYTVGYVNDDGEYLDLRRFRNIKITPDTVIDTVVDDAKTTVLNVDEDGDGKYDNTYKAKENSRGELVKSSTPVAIVSAAAVGLVIAGVIIFREKAKKNRMDGET